MVGGGRLEINCPFLSRTHDSIPFHSIPFHSNPIHSIPFHSIPFQSIPFHDLPNAWTKSEKYRAAFLDFP